MILFRKTQWSFCCIKTENNLRTENREENSVIGIKTSESNEKLISKRTKKLSPEDWHNKNLFSSNKTPAQKYDFKEAQIAHILHSLHAKASRFTNYKRSVSQFSVRLHLIQWEDQLVFHNCKSVLLFSHHNLAL